MARKKFVHEVTRSEIFLFLLKPYLISVFSVMGIAYFSREIVEYSLGADGIADNVWLFWIPGIATVIFWVVFLRRRINLLNIPDWNGHGDFFMHTLVIVAIALTAVFNQFYQKRSNLRMVDIESHQDIDPTNWSACYEYNLIDVEKDKSSGKEVSFYTGRYSGTLNYDAYMVAPFGRSKDGKTMYWLGKVYHTSFQARKSDSYKQRLWDSHYSSSFRNFVDRPEINGEYLYPVQRGEDFQNYLAAINRHDFTDNISHRVFEFYDGDINSESKSMLLGTFLAFLSGLLLMFLYSFTGIQSSSKFNKLKKGVLKLEGGEKEVYGFLLLKSSSPLTMILIYICLLLYFVSAFTDGNLFVLRHERLVEFGGVSSQLLSDGEYWRLLSSMFLHASLLHIIYNMISLVFLGILIEKRTGKLKFGLIYLLSGVVAGIMSTSFQDALTIGASGAVFGLFGWFISASLLFKKRMGDDNGFLLIVTGFAALSLFLGMLAPNTDNFGHLGGLVAGLVFGALIPPKKKSR